MLSALGELLLGKAAATPLPFCLRRAAAFPASAPILLGAAVLGLDLMTACSTETSTLSDTALLSFSCLCCLIGLLGSTASAGGSAEGRSAFKSAPSSPSGRLLWWAFVGDALDGYSSS